MELDFRNIQLGKADAQEEGAEYPDLLLNGYYDNKIGFVSPARRNEAPVCCTAVENVI